VQRRTVGTVGIDVAVAVADQIGHSRPLVSTRIRPEAAMGGDVAELCGRCRKEQGHFRDHSATIA
jgi:hypothetical protein